MKKIPKKRRPPGRTLTFQPSPEVKQLLKQALAVPGRKKGTTINAALLVGLPVIDGKLPDQEAAKEFSNVVDPKTRREILKGVDKV